MKTALDLPVVPLEDREAFRIGVRKRIPRVLEIIDEALGSKDFRERWLGAVEVIRYAVGTHPSPPALEAEAVMGPRTYVFNFVSGTPRAVPVVEAVKVTRRLPGGTDQDGRGRGSA